MLMIFLRAENMFSTLQMIKVKFGGAEGGKDQEKFGRREDSCACETEFIDAFDQIYRPKFNTRIVDISSSLCSEPCTGQKLDKRIRWTIHRACR